MIGPRIEGALCVGETALLLTAGGEAMKHLAVISLALSTVIAPGLAEAAMYAINASGQLYTVDTSDASATLVGGLPLLGDAECCDGYNEIAYDESTSTAWAQERNGNFRAQAFDLSDGSGIGSPVSNGASMHAWEFSSGTLFVAGFAGSLSNGLGILDPSTGTLDTIVDDWGIDDRITGMACSGATMYGISNGNTTGVSQLYSIARADGTLTLIGSTSFRAGSLEFGNDGVLYAGGVSDQAGLLYSVDPTDASSTLIGNTGIGSGGGVSGLMRTGASGAPACLWTAEGVASPQPVSQPVPVLPLFWLFGLAGLLGFIGLRKLKTG